MKTQRESSPVIWLVIIFLVAILMTQVVRAPRWLLESAASSETERFLESAAFVIFGTAFLATVIPALIAGPYFIWWIVRRTNRRDDPRCSVHGVHRSRSDNSGNRRHHSGLLRNAFGRKQLGGKARQINKRARLFIVSALVLSRVERRRIVRRLVLGEGRLVLRCRLHYCATRLGVVRLTVDTSESAQIAGAG